MGAQVIAVGKQNWNQEVRDQALPVVVDLWAPWCGPCRSIAPLLEELAGQYVGKIKVVKVNVDEEAEIAAAFEVQSIPTLVVVYQGGLVGKVVGFGGREQLVELFKEVEVIPEKAASQASDTPT